jgi:murein DD-endopeptidase MepM/ murein hydrolase activator NlpD
MHRSFLLVLLAACAPGAREPDAAGRVARAGEVYERLAAAMRIHDPDADPALYQTRDTVAPAPANLPGLAAVRAAADSLRDSLAIPLPAASDSTLVHRHARLLERVEALRSRVMLLSGDALSIEEAQALQNVAPLDPVPRLSVAVAPAAAEPPPRPALSAAPATMRRGQLVIPVRGVPASQLQDTYTDARSEGRVHNAIDIMAPRGTPVVAATEGKILRLFTSVRGGLTIYQLGNDQRTVYYYAHLDRYAPGLEAGQAVTAGTELGYVGNTGNAGTDNYHLHFAIWIADDPARFWDGAALNPYPLLQHAARPHQ